MFRNLFPAYRLRRPRRSALLPSRRLTIAVPPTWREYAAYHIGYRGPTTTETAIRDGTTVVSVPKPVQLDYCTGMHPIFSRGYWFVDLAIDRLHDNGKFANERSVLALCRFINELRPVSAARSAAAVVSMVI